MKPKNRAKKRQARVDVNLNMNNEKPDLRVTDITSRDTHIDLENKVNRQDNDSFATYNSNSVPQSKPFNEQVLQEVGQVNLRNVAVDLAPSDLIDCE